MDWKFWAGIGIGAIVSAVASLLANYYTPSFSDFINKRKSGFVEKSRKRAVRKFRSIESLQTDRDKKYLTVIAQWMLLLMLTVLTCTWLGATIIFVQITPAGGHFGFPLFVASFTLLFLLAVCQTFANVTLLHYRLSNFDKYKNQVVERWGPLD